MAIEFDPFSNNVELLLHFDGPNNSTLFRDYSVIPKWLTPYGTSKISTTQSKFGGSSGYFDGSGNLELDTSQGLYLASSASTSAVGTPDFTVEAWIYCNGTDSFALYTLGAPGSDTGSTSANRGGLWIRATSGSTVSVVAGNLSTNGWGGYLHRVSVTTLPASGWAHVAVTSENNIPHIFINGVESALAFGDGNTSVTSFANLQMYSLRNVNIMSFNKYQGALDTTAGNGSLFYTGYIDDLRITKGVARYGRFNTPTSALTSDGNTSLLLNFTGANNSTTFTDSSSYNRTVTPYGDAKISTTQSKFGGSSGYFDGTGDYLKIAYSSDFDPGTTDFTAEAWVYCTQYNTSVASNIIGTYSYGSVESGSQNSGWELNIGQNTGYIGFGWGNNGSWTTVVSSTVAVDLNKWNHVAVVKKDNNFMLLKNGVIVAVAYYNTPVTVSKQYLSIGGANNSGTHNYFLYGYLDDVRITKGVARYGAFTPPTDTFYDPIYRPVLQLAMDGADNSTTFLDSSTYQRTVTANNGAAISTAQSVYGGSSAYFAGVNRYLSIPNSTDFNFGANNFTMECWVYFTSYQQTLYGGTDYTIALIAKDGSDANSREFVFAVGGTASSIDSLIFTGFADNSNYTTITGAFSFSLNTWYHVAATRFGNNVYLFVNGTQVNGTTAFSRTIQIASNPIGIGGYIYDGNVIHPMQGYIDEVRIYKGVSLYIKDFTPPTKSYDTLYNDVLVLWGEGTNASTKIIDSAYSPKTITVVGDTKIDRTVNRFGDSSIYFDGSGNYISLPASLGDLNNVFTIEFWCWVEEVPTTYPSAASSAGKRWDIFGQGGNGGRTDQYFCYTTTSKFQSYRGSSLSRRTT